MAQDETVLKFPTARRAEETAEPLWRELVGAVLRTERGEQGLTLGQVAQRAGISPQYLSEVERGRKEPSSEMLAAICGALHLPLVQVLGRIVGHAPIGGRLYRMSPIGGAPTGPVLLAS